MIFEGNKKYIQKTEKPLTNSEKTVEGVTADSVMLSEMKAAETQPIELVSCDGDRSLVEDKGLVEGKNRAIRSKLDIIMDNAQADPVLDAPVVISDTEYAKDEQKATMDVEMDQR